MSEPQIKKTEPMTVAYLQMHGPYQQIPLAMGMLYGWMNKRGLSPTGAPLGVYLTDPQMVPESEATWELWVPVAYATEEAEPDTAAIGIKKLPVMTVASTVHLGPYEDVTPAYEELGRWVIEQGYVLVGPPMEAYLSDPAKTPPEEYETEIIFPVRQA
ncbi:MAG: GyrI-like domain-containing protein [Coriobacteriia bacterium]|nr:GyrI-like domain-containing protein [Coriobacteriia bacterium]